MGDHPLFFISEVMETYTAEHARILFPDYTFHDVYAQMSQRYSSMECYVTWLATRIARGDVATIHEEFIKCDNPRVYLNTPITLFRGGTLMHIALFWCNDEKGKELFRFLDMFSTERSKNHQGEFPYEQRGTYWVDFITRGYIGIRQESEFTELHTWAAHECNGWG